MSEEMDEVKRRLDRLERAMWPMNYPQQPFMPMPVGPVHVSNCPKCGIKWDGAMGYVCPRTDCPTQAVAT